MNKDIQYLLIQLIKEALKDCGLDHESVEKFYLDLPTDSRFGDLSCNVAMRLAKLAKKSPRDVGLEIICALTKRLEKSELKNYIKEVKVEGAGFINFYLAEIYLYQQLGAVIKHGKEALRVDLGHGKKVLIEFVSANPTGTLSVAHARQAAVGDCLANIFDFLGFAVKREYYLNDEGNQINILGDSVRLRMKESEGEKIEFPENYYQGPYIFDIAREAKDKQIKFEELGDFAANFILDIIRKELDDFGVKFDYWSSQKELRVSGRIEKDLGFLKKNSRLYEQDGALWFKSTEFADDKDRVVIKSDGSYTYLAPDICYHQEKYRRGFQWLINLWGPDHHGYISRLKASVAAFGHNPESLSVVIVQLATIFRDGKIVHMSTRKGQYITLREVLDEVGVDASRFFFVMRRTSSHLDFDLDVAKKQSSENPVFYVQYAYARISSILRQAQVKFGKDTDLSVLKEKEELALIRKILQFSSMLNVVLSTLDPFMVTIYLQELSEAFHKFYDQHRVLGQDEAITKARLALIEGTSLAIATGLELLGVSRPEKM
ncbi:MAG: arginine--tRNA ligase [Candidatus Omnitrophica bacterium]|nr:arginine--tRNA ligase [Candidatus Omnitrophota bacterium]